MQTYLNTLEIEFENNANTEIARQQRAYMRNQFEYFGFSAPERRAIAKPFLVKDFLPKKENLSEIIQLLWAKPERDFQQFGQDLAFKYVKCLEKSDIQLFEFMITHKSWWDTVDFIATKLVGQYFKTFPDEIFFYVNKWLQSGNIWLQRTALLFQLKYKNDIDTKILTIAIESLLGSKEFFINKAIGWMLREYSRTNPDWVVDFVEKTELSNLSRREALRLL
jgi:3-methyladenine DNA glycosylase AlkD